MLAFNPLVLLAIVGLIAAAAYYAITDLRKSLPQKGEDFSLQKNKNFESIAMGEILDNEPRPMDNTISGLNLEVGNFRNYRKYSKEETIVYSSAGPLVRLRIFLRSHLNGRYNLLNETEYLVLALIGFIIGGALGFWAMPNIWVIMIVACIGLVLPELYLKFQVREYREAINKQSIILTQLIIQGMRTGVSIGEAFERSGAQLQGPVEKEIEILAEYFRTGFSFQDAAKEAQAITASTFLKKIYQVIIMSLETNISPESLIERLTIIRKNLIIEYYLKQSMKAEASGGNLAKNILIMIVPALLFLVIKTSPAILAPLLTEPIGWVTIVAGVTLYTGGIILSNNVLKKLES